MSIDCYRIKCLRKRKTLEKKKMEIISWLSKIKQINFENINQYK